jgi:hypothetical protein
MGCKNSIMFRVRLHSESDIATGHGSPKMSPSKVLSLGDLSKAGKDVASLKSTASDINPSTVDSWAQSWADYDRSSTVSNIMPTQGAVKDAEFAHQKKGAAQGNVISKEDSFISQSSFT